MLENQSVDEFDISSLHSSDIKYKIILLPGQCASLKTSITFARLDNVKFAINKKFVFDFGHIRVAKI